MAAVLVLTACSSPKSKVIPSDPQKWDQISDDVKKLSDDDRKEFVGFVMRMGMASALSGGKGGIAPGTTIGDAISQQN